VDVSYSKEREYHIIQKWEQDVLKALCIVCWNYCYSCPVLFTAALLDSDLCASRR